MSDDGMNTGRGISSTADVCNEAGSSSSAQHSMAAGSGRDVTESAGSEGPPTKKGKSKGNDQNFRFRRRHEENEMSEQTQPEPSDGGRLIGDGDGGAGGSGQTSGGADNGGETEYMAPKKKGKNKGKKKGAHQCEAAQRLRAMDESAGG